MTMQDFLALSAYWMKYPPTHVLLRAALGIGKKQKRDLGDLLRRNGIDPATGGRSAKVRR
jgi:hypothetical protein